MTRQRCEFSKEDPELDTSSAGKWKVSRLTVLGNTGGGAGGRGLDGDQVYQLLGTTDHEWDIGHPGAHR